MSARSCACAVNQFVHDDLVAMAAAAREAGNVNLGFTWTRAAKSTALYPLPLRGYEDSVDLDGVGPMVGRFIAQKLMALRAAGTIPPAAPLVAPPLAPRSAPPPSQPAATAAVAASAVPAAAVAAGAGAEATGRKRKYRPHAGKAPAIVLEALRCLTNTPGVRIGIDNVRASAELAIAAAGIPVGWSEVWSSAKAALVGADAVVVVGHEIALTAAGLEAADAMRGGGGGGGDGGMYNRNGGGGGGVTAAAAGRALPTARADGRGGGGGGRALPTARADGRGGGGGGRGGAAPPADIGGGGGFGAARARAPSPVVLDAESDYGGAPPVDHVPKRARAADGGGAAGGSGGGASSGSGGGGRGAGPLPRSWLAPAGGSGAASYAAAAGAWPRGGDGDSGVGGGGGGGGAGGEDVADMLSVPPATIHPAGTRARTRVRGRGMPAGVLSRWEVVLLIDTREKAKGSREYMRAHLAAHVATTDVRSLPLGDFLWIVRKRAAPDVEYVLDYILERKILSDLSFSIMDGRWEEQRYRLRLCGLSHVGHIVEGELGRSSLELRNAAAIETAVMRCRVCDRTHVHATRSVDESIAFVRRVHAHVTAAFGSESGAVHCAPASDEADLVGRPAVPPGALVPYRAFVAASRIERELPAFLIFGRQLRQIFQCGTQSVQCILLACPTVASLVALLARGRTHQERLALLTEAVEPHGEKLKGPLVDRLVCFYGPPLR